MPKYRVVLDLEAEGPEQAGEAVAALRAAVDQWSFKAKVHEPEMAAAPGVTVVHTDGGCDNKKGVGAWAFVIEVPGKPPAEGFGAETETTNNRMEMTALIRAFEALEIGPPVLVVADSEYVIKGVTIWSRNWVRNGWKTASGGDVGNRDLWEVLLQLYQLHDVRFQHVRGHTGVPGNERCDELCTQAMIDLHKSILAGGELG